MHTLVSVVTYNSTATVTACVEALLSLKTEGHLCISVTDNSPGAETWERLEDLKRRSSGDRVIITTRSGSNLGWSGGNNVCLREGLRYLSVSPDYVLFVNPDAIVESDAHLAMEQAFKAHPQAGMLGGILEDEDGVSHPGFHPLHTPSDLLFDLLAFRRWRKAWLDRTLPKASRRAVRAYPSGSFFAITRPVLERLGSLDERYFLYYDDEDYARRAMRAGFQVLFDPAFRAHHVGGVSSDSLAQDVAASRQKVFEIAQHSMEAHYRKWYGARVNPLLWFNRQVNVPVRKGLLQVRARAQQPR